MKKALKITASLIVLAVIVIAAQKIFFISHTYDREVGKFVNGMNKTCPSMVDLETRLDEVVAFGDRNLQFNYTLIHMIKDSLHIARLKDYMQPVILSKIKTSPTLRNLVNKDLTWIYSYKDRNGDFIFKITYTPESFK